MLGEKIRDLRKAKKMSQSDFASAMGYSRPLIVNWEKNTRDPDTHALLKIADYFNVSIDYLMGREDYFGNYYRQGSPSSEKLTDKERVMLEEFRGLLPEMQDLVITMMKNLHSEKVKV